MIKGISEVRRLPRLGKIRLGEKKVSQKSGKEYPAATDHFNFKDTPEVEKVFGKGCKSIRIMLPHEDPDVFFQQGRWAYQGSGWKCRCLDGNIASRLNFGLAEQDMKGKNRTIKKGEPIDPTGWTYIQQHNLEVETGVMFDMECLGDECPWTEQKLCKPLGRLMFMMPDVPKFGCYEISTSSINGIIALNSYIDAVRAAAGRVAMIPLNLNLVPKEVNPDGNKKIVYVLELIYQGSIQSLMAMAGRAPAALSAKALPHKEIAESVPEDLIPRGGAALEEHLAQDASEPEDDGSDPAAEAAALMGEEPNQQELPEEKPAPKQASPVEASTDKADPTPQPTSPPPKGLHSAKKKAPGTLF